MKRIIAANFKSNLTLQEIQTYFQTLNSHFNPTQNLEIIVFPPAFALHLEAKNFTLGTQNAYGARNGAFTGELTLDGLSSLDIQCVMIGHSERRSLGEDQSFLAQKFDFYKNAGFKIVYCIGEDLCARQKGKESIESTLNSQLENIDLDYPNLILAYEPIWAIGSGISAESKDIESVHKFLSTYTKTPLLYGGSVNENNLEEILSIPHVNGALIGSRALKIEHFLQMLEIAEELNLKGQK